MPQTIILATHNQGKVKELNQLMVDLPFIIRPQSDFALDDVEETGTTFVENALLKARHATLQTGYAAIADDSGLIVPALNGEPGLYSARYAGKQATSQENIDLLLQRLNALPHADRRAYFYCILVYLRHTNDPAPIICHGYWEGEIAQQPVGDHGFGYDPIFYLPALSCTAAQLSSQQKQQLSHRAQALRHLVTALHHDSFTKA